MQFSIELPSQSNDSQVNSGKGSGNVDRPQVDWAAKDNHLAEVLGIGKHNLIGHISLLSEVGIQALPEQSIPFDDKAKAEQGWRLEMKEDGVTPKCVGARLEKRYMKGKGEVEVLVYPQVDVTQVAISVDFPEKLVTLSKYFNPIATEHKALPFRDIIGAHGWGGFKFDKEGSRKDVVAKPFNMKHTNVNMNRKDAKPHYAFGKTSMIYDLANYCNVLDEEGNFHIKDLSKLLGKACMFSVEVEWNEYKTKAGGDARKLVTKISPSATMSPRDAKFYQEELLPLLDSDVAGMLMFKGGNRERDLVACNQLLINTMSFARNWKDSKLKEELEALKGRELSNNAPDPVEVGDTARQVAEVAVKAPQSKPVESSPAPKAVAPKVVEPVLDSGWDDDIPF